MSNPAQVDNAKAKTMLTPRGPMSQITGPGCVGQWLPVAVEIVTEADELVAEYEEYPLAVTD